MGSTKAAATEDSEDTKPVKAEGAEKPASEVSGASSGSAADDSEEQGGAKKGKMMYIVTTKAKLTDGVKSAGSDKPVEVASHAKLGSGVGAKAADDKEESGAES